MHNCGLDKPCIIVKIIESVFVIHVLAFLNVAKIISKKIIK